MSNTKKPTATRKTTTRKKKTETAPKKERKPNAGQFKKGNTIGKETRFQKDHDKSCKYKEEYCERLIAFFTDIQPQILYDEYYDKDGNLKSKRPSMVIPAKLPTFEGFAWEIGVTVGTLQNWRKEYPQFDTAYARALEKQREMLLVNGTNKQYDGNFSKFLLTNNHGMAEQVKNDVTYKFTLSDEIDEESN